MEGCCSAYQGVCDRIFRREPVKSVAGKELKFGPPGTVWPHWMVVPATETRRDFGQTSDAERGLRSRSSSFTWACLDFLTAVCSGALVGLVRQHAAVRLSSAYPFLNPLVAPYISFFYLLGFAALVVVFSGIFGLYPDDRRHSTLHEQRMTVQATLTAALVLCGALYLSHGYTVSRINLLLTVMLALSLLMVRRGLWRYALSRRFLKGLETRNILIVGSGKVGQALRGHLETLRHMGFRFLGFVSLTSSEEEVSVNNEVVCGIENCVALARSLFVDEIYFSTPADRQIVSGVVEAARAYGIEVRVVPDLYDGLAWNAPVEYVGQFPTIPLHLKEFSRGAFVFKRIIDLCAGSIALLVLSPLMIVIACLIRRDSEGPVLYRALRVGRKGREFQCLKFRTMSTDAESRRDEIAHLNEREDILFKVAKDPRITKLGAKLRKYSLDELPQLFNVLQGEMSLVGPRPPIPSEVAQYKLEHLRRLDVLPGMTGLWQVEARQDPSFDNYISLDTAYVENWSLLLDLRIIARTIGVVLAGTGS